MGRKQRCILVVRIVRGVTSLTDYNIMHVGRVVIVITSKHVSGGYAIWRPVAAGEQEGANVHG